MTCKFFLHKSRKSCQQNFHLRWYFTYYTVLVRFLSLLALNKSCDEKTILTQSHRKNGLAFMAYAIKFNQASKNIALILTRFAINIIIIILSTFRIKSLKIRESFSGRFYVFIKKTFVTVECQTTCNKICERR